MGRHTKGDRVGRSRKVKSHRSRSSSGCAFTALTLLGGAAGILAATVEGVRALIS